MIEWECNYFVYLVFSNHRSSKKRNKKETHKHTQNVEEATHSNSKKSRTGKATRETTETKEVSIRISYCQNILESHCVYVTTYVRRWRVLIVRRLFLIASPRVLAVVSVSFLFLPHFDALEAMSNWMLSSHDQFTKLTSFDRNRRRNKGLCNWILAIRRCDRKKERKKKKK